MVLLVSSDSTITLVEEALSQIRRVLDQPFGTGNQIRIMPNAPAGAGCTIGTTLH
jgi:hypothetical protein